MTAPVRSGRSNNFALQVVWVVIAIGILLLVASSLMLVNQKMSDVGQKREREVARANADAQKTAQALDALRALRRANPHDAKLNADFIILLHRNGNDAELAALTGDGINGELKVSEVANYAKADWVQGLRNVKAYNAALMVQQRSALVQQEVEEATQASSGPEAVGSQKFVKIGYNPVEKPRQAAVQLAKKGQIEEALRLLRQLRLNDPRDADLNADFIVVLRLAGNHDEVARLTADGVHGELRTGEVSSYALMDWIRSLRDARAFEPALTVLRRSGLDKQTDGQLLEVVLNAEAGHLAQSAEGARRIVIDRLSIDQQAQLGYALVLADQPEWALRVLDGVLLRQPDHALALQQRRKILHAKPNANGTLRPLAPVAAPPSTPQRPASISAAPQAAAAPKPTAAPAPPRSTHGLALQVSTAPTAPATRVDRPTVVRNGDLLVQQLNARWVSHGRSQATRQVFATTTAVDAPRQLSSQSATNLAQVAEQLQGATATPAPLPQVSSATGSLDAQREAAVALFRQGQTRQAIDQLRALRSIAPTDKKINADLIVLMRRNNQADEIARLTADARTGDLRVGDVADYALLDWVRALRDAKAFAPALVILQQTPLANQPEGQLLLAVIGAESGNKTQALQWANAVPVAVLNADQQAQLAYAFNLAGAPAQALPIAQRVLAQQPNHALASQQQQNALLETRWGQGGFSVQSTEIQQMLQDSLRPDAPLALTQQLLALVAKKQPDQLVALAARLPKTGLRDDVLYQWGRALRDQKHFQAGRDLLQPRAEQLIAQLQGPSGVRGLGADGLPLLLQYGVLWVEAPRPPLPPLPRLANGLPQCNPHTFAGVGPAPAPVNSTVKPKLITPAVPSVTVLPWLDRIDPKSLGVDQQAQLAYIHRRSGKPAQALAKTRNTLQAQASNRWLQQEQILALSDLGAASEVLREVDRAPDIMEKNATDRLKIDAITSRFKQALAEKDRLEEMGDWAHRFDAIDRVIAEYQRALIDYANNEAQVQRIQNDLVYAWAVRENPVAAVAQFEAMGQTERPAYVRSVAADAYLALRKPAQAERLYRQLRKDSPRPSVPLWLRSYHALQDLERPQEASALLAELDCVVPLWVWPPAPSTARYPNWERLELDTQTALDQAAQGHLATAEKILGERLDYAPANGDLLNAAATVARWRGHPLTAQHLLRKVSAYETANSQVQVPGSSPLSMGTRMNLAANARELEQWAALQTLTLDLHRDFPQDLGVQRLMEAWNDRSRVGIELNGEVGRSTGNGVVFGNQDAHGSARVYSPWFNAWRLFGQYSLNQFDIPNGTQRLQQGGIGVEWQKERKHAWGAVVQNRGQSSVVGLNLGWSQQLDDQWFYSLEHRTRSADVPLRADQSGIKADQSLATVRWQPHESREVRVNMGRMGFDDGNDRWDAGLTARQRVQSSVHHQTDLKVALYHQANQAVAAAYYNPSKLDSIGAGVTHRWITWRKYDQSLTQVFDVSAGQTREAGFGTSPYYTLHWQHEWQLNRRWGFHYGLGWDRRSYDGQPESRKSVNFGLSGKF